MRLDDEHGPWQLIEVCGTFNNGVDSGGYEPIVRPVALEAGHDCSPRKVSPDALVSLGYRVEGEQPETEAEWATDPAELGAPFDTEDA
jgi:hypothetical protein